MPNSTAYDVFNIQSPQRGLSKSPTPQFFMSVDSHSLSGDG